jgi:aspartyl-tRNA(Asn)/glutamyl-tRNA(Gln) amidotransferase subunit A
MHICGCIREGVMNRRRFLLLAASTAATTTLAQSAVPIAVRALPSVLRKRPSRDRLEEALTRIADPRGEGARACLTVYADTARGAADAADARARAGLSLGPLDGTIVSIKDLFDVAGEPTRAGSKVLADAPPAKADAPVVHRLRAAGSVIVAKTNMPEFAFSVFGANPHYGTPGNPADRSRVPGGSSSGAAVGVADGMCEIGIGSDTGASTRTPAAFCGVVGYRPSQGRVPTEGAFPYAYTLDAIGPLARSVADCAAADGIIAGEEFRPVLPISIAGLKFVIPQGPMLANLDETVAARFSTAIATLRRADVRLSDERIALLEDMSAANKIGTFQTFESYAIHRELLEKKGQDYDPIARSRIELGRNHSDADYIALTRHRTRLVQAMDGWLEDVDAVVLPTAKRVAPKITDVSTLEGFLTQQALFGSNTGWASFFNLCAISLPLPREGGLPVGLMLVARHGQDHRLFRIAAAVERLFGA